MLDWAQRRPSMKAAVTSSVVVLGKVQSAQVSEAQPQALHVEAVDLPLLAV